MHFVLFSKRREGCGVALCTAVLSLPFAVLLPMSGSTLLSMKLSKVNFVTLNYLVV